MKTSQQQGQIDIWDQREVIWEDMWEHAREDEWKNVRRDVWHHCSSKVMGIAAHACLGRLRSPVRISAQAISSAIQERIKTIQI